MSFQYPNHFKLPEGERNYFAEQNIYTWECLTSNLIENKEENESRVAIEIGSLHGASAVWLLENFIKRPTDTLHCIDINQTEYLKNNLAPYKNVYVELGLSGNVLCDLWSRYKRPVADLIYIDGSHLAKHVLEDAVLSWKLLRVGGVMIFDDYGWGTNGNVDERPRTGIDGFRFAYQKHYEILQSYCDNVNGYQLYLQKIPYDISDDQLEGNYAVNNPFLNKENV